MCPPRRALAAPSPPPPPLTPCPATTTPPQLCTNLDLQFCVFCFRHLLVFVLFCFRVYPRAHLLGPGFRGFCSPPPGVRALAKAQGQWAGAAGGSSAWAVAAPGASPNPENTPLSYKLRQEIRRQREFIERSERKLRALEIEADLADVPEQWRAANLAGQPVN